MSDWQKTLDGLARMQTIRDELEGIQQQCFNPDADNSAVFNRHDELEAELKGLEAKYVRQEHLEVHDEFVFFAPLDGERNSDIGGYDE